MKPGLSSGKTWMGSTFYSGFHAAGEPAVRLPLPVNFATEPILGHGLLATLRPHAGRPRPPTRFPPYPSSRPHAQRSRRNTRSPSPSGALRRGRSRGSGGRAPADFPYAAVCAGAANRRAWYALPSRSTAQATTNSLRITATIACLRRFFVPPPSRRKKARNSGLQRTGLAVQLRPRRLALSQIHAQNSHRRTSFKMFDHLWAAPTVSPPRRILAGRPGLHSFFGQQPTMGDRRRPRAARTPCHLVTLSLSHSPPTARPHSAPRALRLSYPLGQARAGPVASSRPAEDHTRPQPADLGI